MTGLGWSQFEFLVIVNEIKFDWVKVGLLSKFFWVRLLWLIVIEVNMGGCEGRGYYGWRGKCLIARYPENYASISQLEVFWGWGGPPWWYLEDAEGPLPCIWMIVRFLVLSYPKEDTVKVLCEYLYYKCVKKGVPSWGYLVLKENNRQIKIIYRKTERTTDLSLNQSY